MIWITTRRQSQNQLTDIYILNLVHNHCIGELARATEWTVFI